MTRGSVSLEWWWISVGIATLMSAALLEPHWTDSRSSLANLFVAFGAIAAADHTDVGALWWIYGIVSFLVLITAPAALALRPGRIQSACKWYATRFGRARILGFSALMIEVVRIANTDVQDAVTLLIGLAAAAVISSFDWYRLVSLVPRFRISSASIEVATQPNLVLVSSDEIIPVGSRVEVSGSRGVSKATVVAHLAHRSGSRFQLVLDRSWSDVVDRADVGCDIKTLDADETDTLGFAAEGSTERTIEVHPSQELTYGQPLTLRTNEGSEVLYQVAALRLERSSWDSSNPPLANSRVRLREATSVDELLDPLL